MTEQEKAQNMINFMHDEDPDLFGELSSLRGKVAMLRIIPFHRMVLVVLWAGIDAFKENPNLLKGSHVG